MEKSDRPLTAEETKLFFEQLKERSMVEMCEWVEWAQEKIIELKNELDVRDARIAQLKKRLRAHEEAK